MSLPIFLVLIGSDLYLDYRNDGRINDSLNDGDGFFWFFFVLCPALAVGLPWSVIGVTLLLLLGVGIHKALELLGIEIPGAHLLVIGEFLFYATIFASLYCNALIVAGKRSILGVASIPAWLTLIYVLMPMLLYLWIIF